MCAALSGADIECIASLHVQSIDDSLPALLGERYAARFYSFLAASTRERLFVERLDGRVASVCVVSLAPNSLQARIARGTLSSLMAAAFPALRNAAFRAYLRGLIQDATGKTAEPHPAPEITYIFTDPDARGTGLGAKIIQRVDAALREEGYEAYYVKTLDEAENPAIAFYLSNGFARLGIRTEAGRSYVEFRKGLDAGSTDPFFPPPQGSA